MQDFCCLTPDPSVRKADDGMEVLLRLQYQDTEFYYTNLWCCSFHVIPILLMQCFYSSENDQIKN